MAAAPKPPERAFALLDLHAAVHAALPDFQARLPGPAGVPLVPLAPLAPLVPLVPLVPPRRTLLLCDGVAMPRVGILERSRALAPHPRCPRTPLPLLPCGSERLRGAARSLPQAGPLRGPDCESLAERLEACGDAAADAAREAFGAMAATVVRDERGRPPSADGNVDQARAAKSTVRGAGGAQSNV